MKRLYEFFIEKTMIYMNLLKTEEKMRKNTIVTLSILAFIAVARAQIPVVDSASLQQQIMQVGNMVKQLANAKEQLINMQDQLANMSGLKNIDEVLAEFKNGGIAKELTDTFDKLKSGEFTEEAKTKALEMIGTTKACELGTEKQQKRCLQTVLSDFEQIVDLEKFKDQFDAKIKTMDSIAEKLKAETSMKGIAELQASLAIESNSIQLMEQNMEMTEKLHKQRQKVAQKQALKEFGANEANQLKKELEMKYPRSTVN